MLMLMLLLLLFSLLLLLLLLLLHNIYEHIVHVAFLASFAIKNSQKYAAVYARKLGSQTT